MITTIKSFKRLPIIPITSGMAEKKSKIICWFLSSFLCLFDLQPAGHVNSSYMTAVSNDYGFESTYSRMLEAIGEKGDVLIALSTSGNSENVVNAVKMANSLDMLSVGMSGATGGKIKELCQHNIIIPSSNTARIQEAHIIVGHIFCQIIEEKLFD